MGVYSLTKGMHVTVSAVERLNLTVEPKKES